MAVIIGAATRGLLDVLVSKGGSNPSKYYTDNKKWLESLTQEEIDAIKIYTGNDYKVINQYLRGQIDQLPTYLNQDIIDNINKALNKIQIANSCTVYRGTGIYDDIEKYFTYDINKNLASVDGLIGQTIHEQAFLSTSVDPNASFNYLKVHWTIEVPAGSHGALIDALSYLPEESEMLFSAGQKLIIKEASIVGDTIIIISELAR